MVKTVEKTNDKATEKPDPLASIQQLLAIDEATLDAAIAEAKAKVQAATGELIQLMLLKRSIDMRNGRITRKPREKKAEKKGSAKATDDGNALLYDTFCNRVRIQPCTAKTLAEDLHASEGDVLRLLSRFPQIFARRPDGTFCLKVEE